MDELQLEQMKASLLLDVQRIRMKTDIIYAFEHTTGKKPYDYQRDFLLDTSKLLVVNKSRQTGFTFVAAYKKFWLTWTGRAESEIVISVSKRASDTVMRYVKACARRVGESDKTADVWNADQITWKNGCSVFSLPQAPSTIRSLHGNVLLDEAAHYEKGKEIKEAALPFLSRGFSMVVISTPAGMDELFYESFWQNKHATKMEVPWSECPDLTKENLEFIWSAMDQESIDQEYNCKFVDEAYAYFPYSLIMSRVDSELDYEFIAKKGEFTDVEKVASVLPVPKTAKWVGMDVGRKRDATEYLFLDATGRLIQRVQFVNVPFRLQEAYVRIIMSAGVQRICIDATGMGQQMAENMSFEFGSRVEAVTFTSQSKESMATELHIAFESRATGVRVTIPNDRDLIAQVHSIKRVPTANTIRFDVVENEKHHGDAFWGLALAWRAGFMGERNTLELLDTEPTCAKCGEKVGICLCKEPDVKDEWVGVF